MFILTLLLVKYMTDYKQCDIYGTSQEVHGPDSSDHWSKILLGHPEESGFEDFCDNCTITIYEVLKLLKNKINKVPTNDLLDEIDKGVRVEK